jgi:hypothetical protein
MTLRALTPMPWMVISLFIMALMAISVASAVGGITGPVIHWPPYCPPHC